MTHNNETTMPTARYRIIVHNRKLGNDTEEHLFQSWDPIIPDMYATLSKKYPDTSSHDVYVWDHDEQDIAAW